MKQAIAGVVPPTIAEATSMVVFPTIGSTGAGRLVGRLASIRAGVGRFTLGALLAVMTIPISLAAYVWLFLPFVGRRYRLTNRRIVVQRGLRPEDFQAIGLDEFDTVDIEVLPGQQWLRCGDLSFRRQGQEVLRLSGVSRPEVFRAICLEAQRAFTSVESVRRAQSADRGVA
jgi:hypothetical protein